MGNLGLPDPRVTDFLLFLSLSSFPASFAFHSRSCLFFSLSLSLLSPYLVTVYTSFVTSIVMSLFCFLSLFFRKSFLTFVFLCNVDLNATFQREIPRQQRKTFHFEWFSSTDASLSLFTRKRKLFFIGFFVNNYNAPRTSRSSLRTHFVFTELQL